MSRYSHSRLPNQFSENGEDNHQEDFRELLINDEDEPQSPTKDQFLATAIYQNQVQDHLDALTPAKANATQIINPSQSRSRSNTEIKPSMGRPHISKPAADLPARISSRITDKSKS